MTTASTPSGDEALPPPPIDISTTPEIILTEFSNIQYDDNRYGNCTSNDDIEDEAAPENAPTDQNASPTPVDSSAPDDNFQVLSDSNNQADQQYNDYSAPPVDDQTFQSANSELVNQVEEDQGQDVYADEPQQADAVDSYPIQEISEEQRDFEVYGEEVNDDDECDIREEPEESEIPIEDIESALSRVVPERPPLPSNFQPQSVTCEREIETFETEDSLAYKVTETVEIEVPVENASTLLDDFLGGGFMPQIEPAQAAEMPVDQQIGNLLEDDSIIDLAQTGADKQVNK